jgi:hypothetical protein
LQRGRDFATLADLPRRVQLLDGEAVLDSVQIEEHVVEIGPGVRQLQPCLAVRLIHAPGKPVWAQVEGLTPAGHEHRFYQQIGQSTSLFWPVTADAAAARLTRLSLVSLEQFQRDARQQGFYLEMNELPPPQPNSARPVPLGGSANDGEPK